MGVTSRRNDLLHPISSSRPFRWSPSKRLWGLLGALILVAAQSVAGNDWIGRVQLELAQVDAFPALGQEDRVLILAPHPDDEVLCTGGLIQSAVEVGADVQVVFLTLGDSNMGSFQTYKRRPVVTAPQVRAMGELRRGEALASLALLGVPAESIRFLGYPDAGTLRIWQSHWQESQPLRTTFTRADRVPYSEALSPGAEYRGESILQDLKNAIDSFSPTVIFVSHPDDSNPDHQGLWLFTHAVLTEMGPDYEMIQLWTSLVHYGSWPQTDGETGTRYVLPPAQLSGPGIEWRTLILTDEQLSKKTAALEQHRTQLSFRRQYLESFLRPNELFARIEPARIPASEDAELVSYAQVATAPRFSVLHAVTPATRLGLVEVGLDASDLIVKLQLPRPLGPRESVSLLLFYQPEAGQFAGASKLAVTVGSGGRVVARDGSRNLSSDVGAVVSRGELVIRASLAALGQPDYLFVQAQMRALSVPLEKSGWRIVDLRPLMPDDSIPASVVADVDGPLMEGILGEPIGTPVPAY
jgi:LmbE family N-acetylglucosaminyl deacetylase